MTNFGASDEFNNESPTNLLVSLLADFFITIKQANLYERNDKWGSVTPPYSGGYCPRERRRHSRRDRTEETIKTSAGTTFRQIYTVVGCRRATSDRARFDGGGGPMSNLHTMPTGVVRAIYRRQWIKPWRVCPRWHGPETMRARQQVVDLFLSPPDTNAVDDDNR